MMNVRFNVSYKAPLALAAAVILLGIGEAAQILGAVLIHELGHLIAVYACGGRVAAITVGACGFEITPEGQLSYLKDALVLLSGPLAGLAAVLILRWAHCENCDFFLGANFVYSLFNLLPVSVLDGGGTLYAVISHLCGPTAAWYFRACIDCAVSAVLLVMGLYALFYCANPTLALCAVYMYNLCCKNRCMGVKF